MEIKILGTGCPKCRKMYDLTQQAITELGLDANLVKEEDILKIVEYNILSLPALVIDEVVVSAGKTLSVDAIKELLTQNKTI